ncbi:hypothetical protein [Leucobacter luti]|uniref:Helix-turn-helix protein n=1 Tax=Leucobacter luti TaxID=340320 RepID=A0A4Q7U0C5_9MICO|nr:hypothetical protein [Leucobacter luti]RZT66785.1 hypothetical protein EV139_0912 [Leucobacter luti]
MSVDEKWMSEAELAELTGKTIKTLQNLRAERRLFPFSNPPRTNINVYERELIHKVFESSRVEVRP